MSTPVAYFSMEIAIDTALPTYSGGLGVLAGDTIRGAADIGVPMVAVTLLHRKASGETNSKRRSSGSRSSSSFGVSRSLRCRSKIE